MERPSYKNEKLTVNMNDAVAIRALIVHSFSLKVSKARRRRLSQVYNKLGGQMYEIYQARALAKAEKS